MVLLRVLSPTSVHAQPVSPLCNRALLLRYIQHAILRSTRISAVLVMPPFLSIKAGAPRLPFFSPTLSFASSSRRQNFFSSAPSSSAHRLPLSLLPVMAAADGAPEARSPRLAAIPATNGRSHLSAPAGTVPSLGGIQRLPSSFFLHHGPSSQPWLPQTVHSRLHLPVLPLSWPLIGEACTWPPPT